jgi:hypothetical protein
MRRNSLQEAIVATNLDSLRQQVQALRARGQRLSEALTQAAVEMRDHGLEVSAELIEDLEVFRAEFRALREAAGEFVANTGRAASLDELDRELSQQVTVAAALRVLEAAAALRVKDGSAFAPLERVAAECHSLKTAVEREGRREVAEAVAEGEHPLRALVQLVWFGDQLPDERWETLQDTVALHFGRELSTAVVRGRVVGGVPVAV